MPVPSLTDYRQAYTNMMTCSTASTADITFSFAVFNRTVWTLDSKEAGSLGQCGGGDELDTGNGMLCGMPEDIVQCAHHGPK